LNSERRKRIDEIFAHALDLSGEARDTYVREQCDDEGILLEVIELLDAAAIVSDQFDQRFDAVRERVWSNVVEADETPEENLAGQQAGHWRIGKRLARGGLATVYLAHRDDGEFDQTVAFKVLRRGLDTDDVVTRFRSERQILSSLDHPSIAQILDGGALPDGRPFLVLEYVDGVPITEYCASHDVDVRSRVKFIIEILRALSHAHNHTVVHRDIKPSNILVSSEGNVVLLDFGIAKLLDPKAIPGSSTLTRTGVSLLTPGYGSPEQRAGKPVTTSSDIYQVGVVLYELLTGSRPSFTKRDGDAAEPGPPSQHLKGRRRCAEVRGDLDAIVGKAMHVDPVQRYGSASEMIADLERFLDGSPVHAQPDSLAYRLGKLSKRRPWIFPVIALFGLGIAAYIVTLNLHSKQLRMEQQRAEAAQEFMVKLFSSADPYASPDPNHGRAITVVDALDLGRKRLDSELSEQPALRASLLVSIASVYQSLDQNDAAIELGEDALALNRELYGEKSDAVLENLRLLANAYYDPDDYPRAREYYDRQLSNSREMFSSDDARLAAAQVASGAFEIDQGNFTTAVELLTDGIKILRAAPKNNPGLFITAIVSVVSQPGTFDPQEYVGLLDEALAVATSVYGPNSLYNAHVMLSIARNSYYLGDFERARTHYATGLKVFDRELGPQHRDTIGHLNNYGFLLMGMQDDAGAEKVHRELLDRLLESGGEMDRLVADNYQNLGGAIHRQGRFDEALPLHWKAREIYEAVLDKDHYLSAFPLLSIAYIQLQLGNGAAAEAAATIALDTFRVSMPDTYLEGVATCLVGLGKEQSGYIAEGAAMVQASHALMVPTPQNLASSPYPSLCRVPGSDAP